ncbi:hypothetical protein ACFU5O_37200, partial [Streptomyces sp. NPDC057445]|uniref:hypothetical protein n=1 Tax=Streptomyces sp. NPDC057445 TaxID=3346136 RepID=UPI00367789DD
MQGTIDGIDAVHDRDGYTATRRQLEAMRAAQVQYMAKKCKGDTAADEQGSPCRRAAETVTEGTDTLATTMRSDERAFCPCRGVWFEVQVSRQFGVDSRVSRRLM